MWREYNPNPARKKTDDCTVRAICKAIGLDWETVYVRLAMAGLRNGDMMHKNYVWGGLLEDCGFKRITLPDRCPKCYTVAQFAHDNPKGIYVLGTGIHVVTVKDGDWYDMWDSASEVPIVVYWRADNGI